MRTLFPLLLAACASGPSATRTDSGPADVPDVPTLGLSATITWTMLDDADAPICEVQRVVEAWAHPLVQATFCPDCDHVFAGLAAPIENDCWHRFAPDALYPREEFYSWSDREFHRTWLVEAPTWAGWELSGPLRSGVATTTWTGAQDSPEGVVGYSAVAELDFRVRDDAPVPDPERAGGPYACGWPSDTADLEPPSALGLGHTFPDVPMRDQCGDAVRPWDLAGAPTLVVSVRPDCLACERTVADAVDAGLAVLLLARADAHAAMADQYGDVGPVLADVFVLAPFVAGRADTADPAWALLDSAFTVVAAGTGGPDVAALLEVL